MEEIQPIKLAIVGCGAIASSGHLPAALRSRWIELHALVDVSPTNSQALVHKHALRCKTCTDLALVIDEVEAVLIATPNHTHALVADVALKRGVPALIEKPLATSYADAVRLCDLADRAGTFISVGYRSRHWPAVRLLKRLLDERYFGRIYSFNYELGSSAGWNPLSGYSVQRAQAGGGTLIDAHIVDKILYWFGEPSAFTYADDNHGGIEANCKGTLEFRGDDASFSGSFFLSHTIDLKNRIRIDSERYVCELEEKPSAAVTLFPKGERNLTFEVRQDEKPVGPATRTDFQVQLEEFAQNVRRRAALTVDGRFGARSVKLIEAMYASRQPLPEPWVNSQPESGIRNQARS